MKRSEARKVLMQGIFQMEAQNNPSEDLMIQFIKSMGIDIDKISMKYIITNFRLIIKNLNDIDKVIESNSKGWTIDRIAKVDLAILRLAIGEIYYSDTATAIIINEAVELAKEFGSNNSRKFINGILGTVSRSL